jgi:hypothetical protein
MIKSRGRNAETMMVLGLGAVVNRTGYPYQKPAGSINGDRLLSVPTVGDAKISIRPRLNFQSAGGDSFHSAPTDTHRSVIFGRIIPDDSAAGLADTTLAATCIEKRESTAYEIVDFEH